MNVRCIEQRNTSSCAIRQNERQFRTREQDGVYVIPRSHSAYPHSVGTPECGSFAAEYSARPYPCRRFGDTLTGASA